MEHLTIIGGHEWLGFARNRIAALRATGIEYRSIRFELDSVTIDIRIAGEHDFIRIEETPGGYSCTPQSAEQPGLTERYEVSPTEGTEGVGKAKVGEVVPEFGRVDWLSYSASGSIGDEIITFNPGFKARYSYWKSPTSGAGDRNYWINGEKGTLPTNSFGMARHRESGKLVFVRPASASSIAICALDANEETGYKDICTATFPEHGLFSPYAYLYVSQPTHFSGDGTACVGILTAGFPIQPIDARDALVSWTWVIQGTLTWSAGVLSASVTFTRDLLSAPTVEVVTAQNDVNTRNIVRNNDLIGTDLHPDGARKDVRAACMFDPGYNEYGPGGNVAHEVREFTTCNLSVGNMTLTKKRDNGEVFSVAESLPDFPPAYENSYTGIKETDTGYSYSGAIWLITGLDARFDAASWISADIARGVTVGSYTYGAVHGWTWNPNESSAGGYWTPNSPYPDSTPFVIESNTPVMFSITAHAKVGTKTYSRQLVAPDESNAVLAAFGASHSPTLNIRGDDYTRIELTAAFAFRGPEEALVAFAYPIRRTKEAAMKVATPVLPNNRAVTLLLDKDALHELEPNTEAIKSTIPPEDSAVSLHPVGLF